MIAFLKALFSPGGDLREPRNPRGRAIFEQVIGDIEGLPPSRPPGSKTTLPTPPPSQPETPTWRTPEVALSRNVRLDETDAPEAFSAANVLRARMEEVIRKIDEGETSLAKLRKELEVLRPAVEALSRIAPPPEVVRERLEREAERAVLGKPALPEPGPFLGTRSKGPGMSVGGKRTLPLPGVGEALLSPPVETVKAETSVVTEIVEPPPESLTT